jgi:hypothetical protein
MPVQRKRPHEMTTHEAMEHLFTPEGAEHIKRAVREHDEKDDDSTTEDDSDAPATN